MVNKAKGNSNLNRFRLSGIFFLISLNILAQSADSTKGNWGLELSANYGFLIAHHSTLVPLQEEHLKGIEMNWVRTSHGKKSWEESFAYPDRGITLILFDLGSPEHLGKGFVVYPFYDFPLSRKPDWKLHMRYGIGLGYVEKVFNKDDNFQNAALGSHLNGVFHLDFHFHKDFSQRSALESGIGITHYSNGSLVTPNLGINMATAHLGIIHYFGDRAAHIHRTVEPFHHQAKIQFYLAGAIKKINPPLGKYYQAGTLSVLRLQEISGKSGWGIGADIFYDNSLNELLRREGRSTIRPSDNYRPGIYGAYQLQTGNLALAFNMGFYPYTVYKGNGNIYHRIGLHYYFRNLFLCVNLKTHYARADFVEWGLGWGIKSKVKS